MSDKTCKNFDHDTGNCVLIANKKRCLDGFICGKGGSCSHPYKYRNEKLNCDYLEEV